MYFPQPDRRRCRACLHFLGSDGICPKCNQFNVWSQWCGRTSWRRGCPKRLIQTSVMPICLGRGTWPLKEIFLRGLTQGRQTKLAGMIQMLRAKHSCSMDRRLATSSYICKPNVEQHSPPLHAQQCSNINPIKTETSQNDWSEAHNCSMQTHQSLYSVFTVFSWTLLTCDLVKKILSSLHLWSPLSRLFPPTVLNAKIHPNSLGFLGINVMPMLTSLMALPAF